MIISVTGNINMIQGINISHQHKESEIYIIYFRCHNSLVPKLKNKNENK